jgi:glutamine cyclotransferase
MGSNKLIRLTAILFTVSAVVGVTINILATPKKGPSAIALTATRAIALKPLPTLTPTVTPLRPPTATPTPLLIDPVSPLNTPTPIPTPAPNNLAGTAVYTYEIVNVYPHDREAYTQGLIFVDGVLYEGTGRYGQSTLRRVDLETGEILQLHRLPLELFGEGVTVFGGKIIQLTWHSRFGFVYDKDTFALEQLFTYPTEGWGITHDGRRLIMSDGTSTLYFWDPATLAEIGQVQVYDENGPVIRLNELEYINGEVYANVWQTNRIARINPDTGQVLGWIHLDGLLTAEDLSQPVNVLNGIAYDAENDRLFVTGKLWPKLFEIRLAPMD